MAIDIGDAVLTFLGDTTQLDAAFDKVGTEVPAKLAPAVTAMGSVGQAAKGIGDQLTKTGETTKDFGSSLADAFRALPAPVQATDAQLQNMAFSLTKISPAAEEAGELTKKAMREAKGEAGLLGEMFGIHLPRHVRTFVAELPGVGTVLSAAFAATAVIFIVEALAKGIEKLVEWREEAHKLELAHEQFGTAVAASFNTLDEKLLRAQIKADELAGDHLGALQKELELINHQSLGELEHQFEILSKAADALFEQLKTSWISFDAGSKGAQNALTDFKAKYDLLLAEGKDEEANNLLLGTRKSAKDALDDMEKAKQLAEQVHTTIVHGQVIQEKMGGGPGEKELDSQRRLVAILDAQVKSREKIADLTNQEKDNKNTEEAHRAADEADRILKAQVDAEKRAADQEDKDEDERRNRFIASFEEQEKEKIAATRQGSEERIRIIDAAIKDEEAHGFQDTAFYKSLQVQRVQAVAARVAQEQKAQLDADKQELTNAEQQAKREAEAVKGSSSEQEKAIQDLGKARILSQSETSNRLIAAYQNEKDKTLAILNSLLREEQALMQKASNQLASAKLNPAITPEQLQQAETLLAQLKNAVANTETQIAKVKSDINAKQLAADRSYYGTALALAIAFGKQELAVKLAANHASLLQNQSQLQELKSRKDLTKAQQDQIKVLERLIAEEKKEEKQLESTAKQGLKAWQQFGQGFRADAQLDVKTMQELGQEMRKDLQEFAVDIGAEFAAMIQGTESFGQAMAHATEKLIGKMAQQWGEYFAAKGIADIMTPGLQALGAAEFAAAAALFTVGSLMGSLGSGGGGGGKSSASSGGSAGPAANSPNVNSQQPTQVVNVTHLASGGLVNRPTLAVVGDSAGGGSGREAILPLDNATAMRHIGAAIAAAMKGSGGGAPVEIHFHGGIGELVSRMNRGTQDGTIRVYASHAKNGTALSK
jgi:hypothetical protein